MEQDPSGPQTPSWHQDVGPAKVSGARPTPAWLWLLVIALLGLIFWHFAPRSEVQVSYAPWFLQQVAADNIQSLSIQGTEARGVLRQEQTYQRPTSKAAVPVRRFQTYFPSEASIEPIVQKLTSPREVGSPPVLIEASPPASNGMAWILLLMPMFVVLGLVYLMTRRARDRP
jgi:cell division protease FtsH